MKGREGKDVWRSRVTGYEEGREGSEGVRSREIDDEGELVVRERKRWRREGISVSGDREGGRSEGGSGGREKMEEGGDKSVRGSGGRQERRWESRERVGEMKE